MNFGDAITALKQGKAVKREGWTDGAKLAMFKEAAADMIGWSSNDHPQQVYHPNIPEMLAEDWETV